MYCIDCGQAQPVKDARFCTFCGAELHRPEAAVEPEGANNAAGDALTREPQDAAQTAGAEATPAAAGPAPAALAGSSEGVPEAGPPQDPLNYPLAVTLDRARWVPLQGQGNRLRARLRWALGTAVVLAVLLGGGAAWWWAHQEEPKSEEPIEVERLEAPSPAPSASSEPASAPSPTAGAGKKPAKP
ncbi:MAG: hypothetical protein ACKOE3_02895 [Betaproteobacteria bacterium]